ncbi:MAG: amidophosphoribosyltransferase [Bacteroidales bacterium]|nr:amidophosphoribosyltransferase [Bacteroidales bacterium]
MEDSLLWKDELHEECGVFGCYGVENAAEITRAGLLMLQHRGQQGCGIAARDANGIIRLKKDAGLVREVFAGDELSELPGTAAIGHVRYPTSDIGGVENIQPFLMTGHNGSFALAHNGNIVNADSIRQRIESLGHMLQSTSDSELFSLLIGIAGGDWTRKILSAAHQLDGAFSTLILTPDALYACRDRYGLRPLSIGRMQDGYIVASETCALEFIGADFVRDVEPGELIRIDAEGIRSYRHSLLSCRKMCSMEYIYFARPDSDIEGCSVHAFRKRSGALLWKEHPVEADLVMCVPESGMSAAIGYAEASGIPLEMGLLKNIYVARTFIQPTQSLRNLGVRMKLSPVQSIVAGKRIVVIDDSIVRGTTSRQIVQLLRSTGAREIHMCIASPVYAWPCFYGIDTGTRDQLIGARMDEAAIRDFIGADTLHYLSVDALSQAAGGRELCTACFDGRYPSDLYGQGEA